MASQVEVRRFQSRDLSRILEIEQASFGPDAWDRALLVEYFHRCPDLFLVARWARRVGGYVITCPSSKDAELVSIAVDPSDRLRGLGRAMLDQSLSKLRSLGLRSWWLMVETTNDPAIQFYESYGFRRMRRTKRYYGAGRDAWRMKFVI